MDVDTFVGITAILALLATIVNLYNMTIKKPQDIQNENQRETEKALTDFIITTSGQTSEMRTKIESIEGNVSTMQNELNVIRSKLVRLETIADREGGEEE